MLTWQRAVFPEAFIRLFYPIHNCLTFCFRVRQCKQIHEAAASPPSSKKSFCFLLKYGVAFWACCVNIIFLLLFLWFVSSRKILLSCYFIFYSFTHTVGLMWLILFTHFALHEGVWFSLHEFHAEIQSAWNVLLTGKLPRKKNVKCDLFLLKLC